MTFNPKKIRAALQVSLSLRRGTDLASADVADAREYIVKYWANITRFHPNDDETLLGLPEPYIVPSYTPSATFDYQEMYYWDSFFIAQGFLDKDHEKLTEGILDDLLSMLKRFDIIPNASRTYLTGRSQPPFLTTFIFDVYEKYKLDKKWLKSVMELAEREYTRVWRGTKKPNDREVYKGLSRNYEINMLHDLAETESGWDLTPRFNRRALDYLPVDLNALLYKYEIDFAKAARIFGNLNQAAKWERLAEHRKRTMNELMWDRIVGLYYDYDYTRNRRSSVSSLAAYYPMWAGMVDKDQAQALVRALRRFEHKGGLTATYNLSIRYIVSGGNPPTQWAYPNGWAPLHFLVVQALERYGYHADAKRIAMKWLKCNLWWFNAHGEFLEKYNVVTPEKPPVQGVYPTQVGFGWTNAIFERFCRDYIDKPAKTT